MAYEGYDLSALLRRKRKEWNMSLREFSEHLGISHAYLDKLEKGLDPRSGKAVTPTIDTLVRIAEGLHLSARDFLDLCGYFESKAMPFDLENAIHKIEISLQTAEIVNYGEVTLTDEDIAFWTKQINQIKQRIQEKYSFADS